MSRRFLLAFALSALVPAAGCFEFANQTPTNPNPSLKALGGTWTSQTANATSLLNTCTNFTWQATQKTSTEAAGNFTATCFQVFEVTGSVHATFSGSTINWTASGAANGACTITLNGTGTLTNTQLTLQYTGDTCQGPVSGTEILVKS